MPMLEGDDRVTGSSGGITFENTRVGSGPIFIPVTSWSVRCEKFFQDTTNSANYHWQSSLVYPTQSPCAARVEGEIEGRFRLSTIPYTILASLFDGSTTGYVISLYITQDYLFGIGMFLVSHFATGIPHDDVVNFSSRIISYGPFEVNTSPWVPGFGF